MHFHKGYFAAGLFLIVFLGIYLFRKQETTGTVATTLPYQTNQGLIFGTTYRITYQCEKDLQTGIDSVLLNFDRSLSPFNKASVITKVNENDTTVVIDDWFTTVFNKSKEVYKISQGAFDPTVSPLINAWGFGFKKGESVSGHMVDSLLNFVGLDKIELHNGKIKKQDNRMTLNFSAIAKGFASDVIAGFLSQNGIKNYMVEIGGEVVAKGVNSQGKIWRIGINKPTDNAGAPADELEAIIPLENRAMATSGNYRNFYYKDGKKYAHTIDPKSGYPIQHTLLSATVLADDCMTADAFATAFMVLGVERSMEIASRIPGMDVFLIYALPSGDHAFAMTPAIEKLIKKEK